jgi:uncharacterized membrane protein YecN with MAPEG domain
LALRLAALIMDQIHLPQFDLQLKALRFFGLWQPKNSPRALKIRGFVSHSAFLLVTLILPAINLKFFEANFDDVCVHIAFFLGPNLKIPILIFQMQKLVQTFEDLKTIINLTKSYSTADRVHLRKQSKFMARILKFFFAAIAVINTLDLMSSLYGHHVPYKTWIPHKLQIVVDHPDLFSIAQVLLISSVELISISIEVLPTFFIGMSSVLLLELSERMETFRSKTTEEENYSELKTCVQIHQRISEFVCKVEKQFSAMLFIQGFVSSAYLCFVVLSLSKVGFCIAVSTNFEFANWSFAFSSQIDQVSVLIKESFIVLAALTVIFLPNFIGQQVTSESEKLNQSLFNYEHLKGSKKFKSSLLIFMERLKQPSKVAAFGVFTINLETFKSIINMAYSLFMALKTLKEE